MVDMISPDDEDLLDEILTVLEFDTEDERNSYIRREKIKKVLQEGEIIPIRPLVSPPSTRSAAKRGKRK